MDGHAVSPLDLSQTLPVGGGLLVLYSLPGSPVIKQLMQLARVGGFSQCASPNSTTVKNPLASAEMWEMWAQAPGQEDLLEEEMATHSSILA